MNKRTLGVLLACFCTVLAAYSIRYSYGTLLPEMLLSLSITKAQAGVIYSSYFIAYTVFSPILGIIADRFNLRYLIAGFVALMGVGTFLMQYPSSVWQASLFFTIAGIGCAACWTPVMVLALRWISNKRRGMSLAFIDAGSTLGVIVAGTIIPLVVDAANWHTGWLALGIMGLAVGAINLLFMRNYPLEKTAAAGIPSEKRSGAISLYKPVLVDKRFWLIGIAYMLTGFAIIIPFTFLSTYAVQEIGVNYGTATLLITFIGAGGLLGKLTLGPLSDKVGRIGILLVCALLIGGGCLAMVLCHGWILMAVCFIYGIGYGACWALYAACASDIFSKQAAGGIVGLWTFLMGFGSILAPILAGWLADYTGTLMWAFLLAMAAGFISFVLLLPMLKVPRTSTVTQN